MTLPSDQMTLMSVLIPTLPLRPPVAGIRMSSALTQDGDGRERGGLEQSVTGGKAAHVRMDLGDV